MNVAAQAPIERMSITEIEAELAALAEAGRSDAQAHERRDFNAETNTDPQEAAEISAEQTLYFARQRRRAARRGALETALAALKASDVNDKLTNLKKVHDEALADAQTALANIDFEALTALEEQVSDYLAAEAIVRDHACKASSIAKNADQATPGFESIYAHALGATYDRLERLKAQIASSSQRVSNDHSRLGVPFRAI